MYNLFLLFFSLNQLSELNSFKRITKVTKTVTPWPNLFKEKEASEKILRILKEDDFISESNIWMKKGREMVALFMVLKKQGYINALTYSAQEIADSFNNYFQSTYSYKNFEMSGQDKAEHYKDKFNRITKYIPSK